MSETSRTREELVAALPPRTAHALHALIVATVELKMPVTAAEAVIYDEEALSARSTGQALRQAARRGYAVYTGRYWLPANTALELRATLEDRYLAEVGDELL